MAFKKMDGELTFTIKEDGINELIDEKGSLALMLREVAWGNRESHLELRSWKIDPDKEFPMKGTKFLTEEGPHKLAEVLVDKGFGTTTVLLSELKNRPDFDNALVTAIGKVKVEKAKASTVSVKEDDYFDPKEAL